MTLDNFSFICPTGSPITTDKAQLFVSEDRKVYTIVIPENYGHKDNQYIAKVTFSDGTVAKKSFVVEYNPPRITEQKVERISETSFRYRHKDNQYIAKVTFSDGTVAKKSFVVEYNPPRITEQKVERISETSFRYSFVSDRRGLQSRK